MPVGTEETTSDGYADVDFIAREAAKILGEDQPEVPDEEVEVEARDGIAAEPDTEPSDDTPAPKHWSEYTITDDDPVVKNNFFKGKTVGDLYKSYENLERKLQEQGRELNRAKTENALAKTLEALEKRTQEQPPEAKPEPSLYEAAGIDPERDPFLDWGGTTEKTLAEFGKRLEEKLRRELRGEIQETEKQRAEREASEAGQRAFVQAMDSARDQLQMDDKRWKRLAPAVMTEIGQNPTVYGENAVYDPAKITEAATAVLRELGVNVEPRKQSAGTAAPTVPESPNPPGSTRPAGASVASTSGPTLKSEERQMAEDLWPVLAAKQGLGDDDKKWFMAEFARKTKEMGARR